MKTIDDDIEPRKIYITEEMYCSIIEDNLEITIQKSKYTTSTNLNKGTACKLIKILSEYLIDMEEDLIGDDFDEPETIGYFNTAAVDTNITLDEKGWPKNKVESEIISTKDE